jgi:signal recognition particle subunit SRP19
MESTRKLIGKKIVIYPSYLDFYDSKTQGRKVSRFFSVQRPTAKEIYSAAERLGLNPVIEKKKYPKAWWEETERVIVSKSVSKRETLKMIAAEIKKMRGS